MLYPGVIRGDQHGNGFPKGRSYKTQSLEEECGLLRMRCRETRDFARTGFDVSVRVDRGLRFPQLQHSNGEHDRRGINILLSSQHFQKCDGLG